MEMTLIKLGLFAHIGSAILMFCGLAVELFAGHFLTRAEDASQVRILAKAALLADRVFNLALVGLLVTGPDLASRTGFFEGDGVKGWVAVAIVVIVILGGLGGAIHRKGFKAILAEAGEGNGPISVDLRTVLVRPAPWISMFAATGAGLSSVWLMSNKPSGVLAAALVAVIGLVVGAALGMVAARQTASRLGA